MPGLTFIPEETEARERQAARARAGGRCQVARCHLFSLHRGVAAGLSFFQPEIRGAGGGEKEDPSWEESRAGATRGQSASLGGGSFYS